MDAFYAFALSFASEHWFLTWCALWLVWLPLIALSQVTPIITRIYRVIMVSLRGWPPAHLDADGDWRPAPKVDEKTETATVGDMSHTVKTRTESGPTVKKRFPDGSVRKVPACDVPTGNPDWDPAPGAYNPGPTTRRPRPGDPDYIASIDG